MTSAGTDPAIDPTEFRRVMGRFPTGVTVVTSNGPDGLTGAAIGSFASISLDPCLVGFFLKVDSSSLPAIEAAGSFCVNLLRANQLDLCAVMASRSDDKFAGIEWRPAPATGSPIFSDIMGFIDCRVERTVDLGDHKLIVGAVQALDAGEDTDPMVFFTSKYGTFAAP